MTIFSHFAGLAATSLVSTIWQSAVLAVCVAVSLRLLPGVTAAARSLIWSGVFVLTLALLIFHLVTGASNPSSAGAGLRVAPGWALALCALWASLSLFRAGVLLVSAIRLYRVAAKAVPVSGRVEPGAMAAAAASGVQICTSVDVDVPSVAGFFHPRILLPAGLLATISSADLEQVVVHELEHLRRRDDWTNLLQKVALALLPVNPVLLWVERQLCVERELACDDGVLRATGGAGKAYATCLANLAEGSMVRRGLSLALGAWERESELSRRIHRVLRSSGQPMPRAGAGVLGVLMIAAVVGTGTLATRSPQLITFGAAPEATASITDASLPIPPHPFRPVLAKAMMVEAQPALRLAVQRKPAHRVRPARVFAAQALPGAETGDVIVVGWRRTGVAGRWTRAVYPSSTFTYAAVPTRSGWLFFQL